MPREVTCSACNHVLRIAEGSSSPWLTCPRCLARVVNPHALVQTPGAPGGIQREPPPARPAERLECPGCGQEVRAGWRLCPHCGVPIGARTAPRFDDSLERDVRRDSRAGLIVTITLAAFLLIGIILFLAHGGMALVGASKEGTSVVVIGGVMLLGIVAGVGAIAFRSKNRAVTAVSGVLGGLAVGAGAVLLVTLLMCLALLAAFQNFLETCSKCGR